MQCTAGYRKPSGSTLRRLEDSSAKAHAAKPTFYRGGLATSYRSGPAIPTDPSACARNSALLLSRRHRKAACGCGCGARPTAHRARIEVRPGPLGEQLARGVLPRRVAGSSRSPRRRLRRRAGAAVVASTEIQRSTPQAAQSRAQAAMRRSAPSDGSWHRTTSACVDDMGCRALWITAPLRFYHSFFATSSRCFLREI